MADQSQLKAPDVYGRTHQMDEKTLGAVAERLEARGRHPFFARAIGDCRAPQHGSGRRDKDIDHAR
jgi:hypothetical protein